MKHADNADCVPTRDRCAEWLFATANAPDNPMAGLPGAMAVSADLPLVVAPEFPPQRLKCPHGFWFWTYPNRRRIDALRDLGGPS